MRGIEEGEGLELALDLRRALALFLLVESRAKLDSAEGVELHDDLDSIEAELRSYLYNRLSIEEMEKPEELYRSLLRRKS